jgi:hypothetical protein
MRNFLGVSAAALILFFILNLIPLPTSVTGEQTVSGLPWQVEVLGNGQSRVFGLTIGASTFADAATHFGATGELAIVAAPGESGTLEMYFNDVTAGAVTGKMLLTADLPAETVTAMRERAAKVEYMQSSTKKAMLAEQDVAAALQAVVFAVTFIPTANLDEDVIVQRFGKPVERIRTAATLEHFLYPERGLDLALDSEGKEVLQYVVPSRFETLRQPLLLASTSAATKP